MSCSPFVVSDAEQLWLSLAAAIGALHAIAPLQSLHDAPSSNPVPHGSTPEPHHVSSLFAACLTCDPAGPACLTCAPGNYLNATGGCSSCSAAGAGCLACAVDETDDTLKCSQCRAGSFVDGEFGGLQPILRSVREASLRVCKWSCCRASASCAGNGSPTAAKPGIKLLLLHTNTVLALCTLHTHCHCPAPDAAASGKCAYCSATYGVYCRACDATQCTACAQGTYWDASECVCTIGEVLRMLCTLSRLAWAADRDARAVLALAAELASQQHAAPMHGADSWACMPIAAARSSLQLG